MFNKFYNSVGTYSRLLSNHVNKLQNVHVKTKTLASSTVSKIIQNQNAAIKTTTTPSHSSATAPVTPGENHHTEVSAVPLPANPSEISK